MRDFRWYWLSQSANVAGSQIATFLLPTMAIVLFHASSLQVGSLIAVNAVAYPALGLFVGVLADRIQRRPIMILADLAKVLAFAWIPVTAVLGGLDMTDLFLVALAAGTVGVLFDVAGQSHLPTLLPASMLAMANARVETSTAIAVLGAPVLGGLLMELFTGTNAMVVTAGLSLLSVLALLQLSLPEPPASPRAAGSKTFTEIRDGVTTLLTHPLLRPTTVAGVLRNLGNSAAGTVALVFAYQALKLTPGTVGLLLTVSGAAGIVGAWLSNRVLSRLGLRRTLIIACVTGSTWMAAPLALWLPAIPTYLAVGALVALWLPVWNTTITTLRQTVTPWELLGRVHATARAISFCAVPVGAIVGGAGADALSSALGAAAGLSVAFIVVGLLAGSGTVFLVRSALPADGSVPTSGEELRDGPAGGEDGRREREETADGHGELR
ncbi:MAG: MFS transporter [Actinobacteria bacterium]|nr:MFS transporter [Acidobacteriota bacterium]MCA1727245.1 MFS transporter [Actinomycetota bacterium]